MILSSFNRKSKQQKQQQQCKKEKHQQQEKGSSSSLPISTKISYCTKFQKWFWFLIIIWCIYCIGMIISVIGIHKLDTNNDTSKNQKNQNTNIDSPHLTTNTMKHMMELHADKLAHYKRNNKKTTTTTKDGSNNLHSTNNNNNKKTNNNKKKSSLSKSKSKSTKKKNSYKFKNPNYNNHIIRDEKTNPMNNFEKPKTRRRNFQPKPYGHMVKPDSIVVKEEDEKQQQQQQQQQDNIQTEEEVSSSTVLPSNIILTAYLEQMDIKNGWDHALQNDYKNIKKQIKPLPIRKTKSSNELYKIQYKQLNSCYKLPSQWPIDNYPGNFNHPYGDPYLPWIHDVFPTHDGTKIQFVVQNHRRCNTGTTTEEELILDYMAPQVSLFQHVPIKRIYNTNNNNNNDNTNNDKFIPPRYKLTSHNDADIDGIATRFICRFKYYNTKTKKIIILNETLSLFNHDYEWASTRKHHDKMFQIHGRDNKVVHTSQLMFYCPTPTNLHSIISNGNTISNNFNKDYPNYFIDLIPIRTLPRYISPSSFLQPKYSLTNNGTTILYPNLFNTTYEWGTNHVLPLIENSGRWENIPICKPSLLTYELTHPIFTKDKEQKDKEQDNNNNQISSNNDNTDTDNNNADNNDNDKYKHKLVNCLWASSGYTTRGNRYAINDGQRRIIEWITYHTELLGWDHIYLYDNTGAFFNNDTTTDSLKYIVEKYFPTNLVTVIDWPSKVCNNNPNNVDSVGERSSQYAAETSCRLRFGEYVNWIGQFDIDEYLIPMYNLNISSNTKTTTTKTTTISNTNNKNDNNDNNNKLITTNSGHLTNGYIYPLLDKLDKEGTKIISFASWRAWPRRTHINEPINIYDNELCGRNTRKPADICFELSIPKNNTILQSYNCDRQKPGEKKSQMPAEKQIYKASYVKQHFIHYSTVTELSLLTEEEYKLEMTKLNKKVWTRPFPDPKSRFTNEQNEGLMLHTKAIARQDTMSYIRNCHLNYSTSTYDQCRIGFPWPNNIENLHNKTTNDGWIYNCYVNEQIENYLGPLLQMKLNN